MVCTTSYTTHLADPQSILNKLKMPKNFNRAIGSTYDTNRVNDNILSNRVFIALLIKHTTGHANGYE